jgi:hypothetical protein
MSLTASSRRGDMHTLEIHGNSITLDFNMMNKEQALQVIAHWAALGDIDNVTLCSWTNALSRPS